MQHQAASRVSSGRNPCAFHLLLSLPYVSGHFLIILNNFLIILTIMKGLFFPLFQVWFYPFSFSSAGDNTEPSPTAPITSTVHYRVRDRCECAWHRLGLGRTLPASPVGALGWSLPYRHAGTSVMLHSAHPCDGFSSVSSKPIAEPRNPEPINPTF